MREREESGRKGLEPAAAVEISVCCLSSGEFNSFCVFVCSLSSFSW